MTKIAVITATYPSEEDYGGVFVRDHCKMLKQKGFDVSVLYSKSLRMGLEVPNKIGIGYQYTEDGIHVYVDETFRIAATYTVPLLRLSIKNSCERLYKAYCKENGKPDILISHFSYPAGIGAAYLSRKYHIPLLAVEHLSLLNQPDARPWMNRSISEVMDQASNCVCVSEGLRDGLRKRLKTTKEISVIPNPIDGVFHFSPRKKNENSFVFLSIGSLRKVKNFSLLIRVFASAFQENKRVKLRIAGEGPEKESLLREIEELGMQEQVTLLGCQTRDALLHEYQSCDCFVLLSKTETFGIVYREAMSVGRPVITSDNPGIRSDWEDSFGMLLPSLDIEAVAKALNNMFQHSAEFDEQYISNRMKELYSESAVGEKYKAIIMDILGEKTK